MKLLRVTAKNFRNCKDNFSIDFVKKSNKNDEDLIYELQEIAPDLYTFNTIAFIGKNASGKTTAIELLFSCYSILGSFHLSNKYYFNNNEELIIYFFHDGFIYKYRTILKTGNAYPSAYFEDEHIYRKKYSNKRLSRLFDSDDFEELNGDWDLPADTSKLYYIIKKHDNICLYYDCDNSFDYTNYNFSFNAMKEYNISMDVFNSILKIFDNNIKKITRLDLDNYEIYYKDYKMQLSSRDLYRFLSSGTTKGIGTYISMAVSLNNGIDFIIDEIEAHFHKTLVENIIALYKDPYINTKHATLLFTTHYCELLDLFNRQDNIWITKSDEQVYIENMYEKYKLRPDAKKSKQFYYNTFETSVNYDDLMTLKKALKRGAKT